MQKRLQFHRSLRFISAFQTFCFLAPPSDPDRRLVLRRVDLPTAGCSEPSKTAGCILTRVLLTFGEDQVFQKGGLPDEDPSGWTIPHNSLRPAVRHFDGALRRRRSAGRPGSANSALVSQSGCRPGSNRRPCRFPHGPLRAHLPGKPVRLSPGLTSIQPYSGWRSAGTRGEAEALDYVSGEAGRFHDPPGLGDGARAAELQSFHEHGVLGDAPVPDRFPGARSRRSAEGMRGSRWVPLLARAMDSDGALNDSGRDPLAASGPILAIRDANTLYNLEPKDVKGRVLFLDYALVDTITEPDALDHGYRLLDLMDQGALGLVLVSQFSNAPGVSHGVFAGDGAVFQYLDRPPNAHIPILHARLSDLSSAGIAGWDDFAQVELCPDDLGHGRPVAGAIRQPGSPNPRTGRLAGGDPGRAHRLAKQPRRFRRRQRLGGAAGSRPGFERIPRPGRRWTSTWPGSAGMRSAGTVLPISPPPTRSFWIAALAMIQMDCLGHPLDGRTQEITLSSTSYDRFGDDRLPWSDYLTRPGSLPGDRHRTGGCRRADCRPQQLRSLQPPQRRSDLFQSG